MVSEKRSRETERERRRLFTYSLPLANLFGRPYGIFSSFTTRNLVNVDLSRCRKEALSLGFLPTSVYHMDAIRISSEGIRIKDRNFERDIVITTFARRRQKHRTFGAQMRYGP